LSNLAVVAAGTLFKWRFNKVVHSKPTDSVDNSSEEQAGIYLRTGGRGSRFARPGRDGFAIPDLLVDLLADFRALRFNAFAAPRPICLRITRHFLRAPAAFFLARFASRRASLYNSRACRSASWVMRTRCFVTSSLKRARSASAVMSASRSSGGRGGGGGITWVPYSFFLWSSSWMSVYSSPPGV
jgi:hypothetical protein